MRDPNALRRSLAVFVVTSSGLAPGRVALKHSRLAVTGRELRAWRAVPNDS